MNIDELLVAVLLAWVAIIGVVAVVEVLPW